MKTNTRTKSPQPVTFEGGPASRIKPEQELRRTLMSCMLFESSFYESGESIADRLAALVPQVDPAKVAGMAIEARTNMKLRHAPLLIVREMARHKTHAPFVAGTLYEVIQRADELAEFCAIWQLTEKKPLAKSLSKQAKVGLARAFQKFGAYDLAKYNRDGAVRLRDVLFLSHAKPKDAKQADDWMRLTENYCECGEKLDSPNHAGHEKTVAKLPIPDTWETNLSKLGEEPGQTPEQKRAAKKEAWTRLLTEKKMGALAVLRNLRNFKEAGVDEATIFAALAEMKTERVLPYRFIAAARYAPQWESQIEIPMLKCLEEREKLPGKTVLVVDVSGSMSGTLSDKSEMTRKDAASGLAILARELCESVAVYAFASTYKRIPDRHGFALRDAVQAESLGGGTELGRAIEYIRANEKDVDRVMAITDEQIADRLGPPPAKIGYIINVASYQNGVGYGDWVKIDGFSEAIFDYIMESERAEAVSDE